MTIMDMDTETDSHDCGLCGRTYRSRGAALRCCTDRFDDSDDSDPDPNADAVAREDGGRTLVADGGSEADQEMVAVCPNCEQSGTEINSAPSMNGPAYSGKKYRCKRCREAFDEPDERPRQEVGSCISSTHALSLADADPDLDLRASAEQAERRAGR